MVAVSHKNQKKLHCPLVESSTSLQIPSAVNAAYSHWMNAN
jgi:hypothetical protein